jgi:hypothetical protein
MGGVFLASRSFLTQRIGEIMKNIKFVVRVSRGDARAPAYVQRIDPTPVQMTTNRKLALMMGKITAEDAVKSIQTSQCVPELVPVQVAV